MVEGDVTPRRAEDIDDLKRELRALKRRLIKLTSNLVQLELLGSQNTGSPVNLPALPSPPNPAEGAADTSLIGYQRKLAEFIVSSTLMVASHFITCFQKYDFGRIKLSAAAVVDRIQESNNPLHEAIRFYNKTMELAEESGIKGLYLDLAGEKKSDN